MNTKYRKERRVYKSKHNVNEQRRKERLVYTEVNAMNKRYRKKKKETCIHNVNAHSTYIINLNYGHAHRSDKWHFFNK